MVKQQLHLTGAHPPAILSKRRYILEPILFRVFITVVTRQIEGRRGKEW
jgi:hypothetical protein